MRLYGHTMGAKAVYRLIILMLAALLAFAAAASYVGWRNMREENTELELGRLRLEEQKASLAAEKAYKQEYFSRLIYDEEFAARVIREKLGFAEPDEIIFRFEDSSPPASERREGADSPSGAVEVRTAADRAERDGAPYLRATILDRIFSSVPDSAGGFESGGGETSLTGYPAASPPPARAESASGENAGGDGGIKIPEGPNPIIFRND